jgi:hypothetical protein
MSTSKPRTQTLYRRGSAALVRVQQYNMLCKRGWANNRSTRRRAHNSLVEKQISNTCEIQDAHGNNNKANGKH